MSDPTTSEDPELTLKPAFTVLEAIGDGQESYLGNGLEFADLMQEPWRCRQAGQPHNTFQKVPPWSRSASAKNKDF